MHIVDSRIYFGQKSAMNSSESSVKRASSYLPEVSEKLRQAGFSPLTIAALIDFDSAQFFWHRRMMKGEGPARMLAALESDLELSHFYAITAVLRIETGMGRARAEPATIGLLAEELAVDPSRASRTANDLIARGYFRRDAAQDDGRKSILVPTAKARDFIQRFLERKWSNLITIFQDWSIEDITAFSRLFQRYCEDSDRVSGTGS